MSETTPTTIFAIPEEQRTLAAMAHLSGLAGYVIPFGGAIVPIIIWIVKSDDPLISSIAQQALFLNIAVFLLSGLLVLCALTIILIPVTIIGGILIGLAALALPIVGAIKAWDGVFFRYPVVGMTPR